MSRCLRHHIQSFQEELRPFLLLLKTSRARMKRSSSWSCQNRSLEYDPSALTPDAELKRDLGMTSLDAVEMAIFIKRTFGFQPERNAVKTLLTLQELCDYIAKHTDK